jgi:hypothetical protein
LGSEIGKEVGGTGDSCAQLVEGSLAFLVGGLLGNALFLIAQKEAEIAEFKVSYDALKAEYDTIAAKDDQGTATDADYTRLDELEILYRENQAMFDEMENDRLLKVRDNLEKAYNKEKSAFDKMTADIADK